MSRDSVGEAATSQPSEGASSRAGHKVSVRHTGYNGRALTGCNAMMEHPCAHEYVQLRLGCHYHPLFVSDSGIQLRLSPQTLMCAMICHPGPGGAGSAAAGSRGPGDGRGAGRHDIHPAGRAGDPALPPARADGAPGTLLSRLPSQASAITSQTVTHPS